MLPSRVLLQLKPKMVEWLAVVYDKPGVDRTPVRTQHLANIPATVNSGRVTTAGAVFNSLPQEGQKPDFAGSVFTIVADTKEEVLAFLKEDIYAKQGVWDLNNVLVYPVGIAYRKAKDI